MDPEPDTVWRHTNGNLYVVVCITNRPDEPRYPKTVVYRNQMTSTLWSRPISDWHRSFTFAERDRQGSQSLWT